jgi:hypothetical protein
MLGTDCFRFQLLLAIAFSLGTPSLAVLPPPCPESTNPALYSQLVAAIIERIGDATPPGAGLNPSRRVPEWVTRELFVVARELGIVPVEAPSVFVSNVLDALPRDAIANPPGVGSVRPVPNWYTQVDLSTVGDPFAMPGVDGLPMSPSLFGTLILSFLNEGRYLDVEPLLLGQWLRAEFDGIKVQVRLERVAGPPRYDVAGMRLDMKVADVAQGKRILHQLMVANDVANLVEPSLHYDPYSGTYVSNAGTTASIKPSNRSTGDVGYVLSVTTPVTSGADGRTRLVSVLARAFSFEDTLGGSDFPSTDPLWRTVSTPFGTGLLQRILGSSSSLESAYSFRTYVADFGMGPKTLRLGKEMRDPGAFSFVVRARNELEGLIAMARFLREVDQRAGSKPDLTWDPDERVFRSSAGWWGSVTNLPHPESGPESFLPEGEGDFVVRVVTRHYDAAADLSTMLTVLADSHGLDTDEAPRRTRAGALGDWVQLVRDIAKKASPAQLFETIKSLVTKTPERPKTPDQMTYEDILAEIGKALRNRLAVEARKPRDHILVSQWDAVLHSYGASDNGTFRFVVRVESNGKVEVTRIGVSLDANGDFVTGSVQEWIDSPGLKRTIIEWLLSRKPGDATLLEALRYLPA